MNESAQDTIARLTRERDEALHFITSRGYRRCDIPACNCNSWHGGFANKRLSEIYDELGTERTNGTTALGAVKDLIAVNELRFRELAEAREALGPFAEVERLTREQRGRFRVLEERHQIDGVVLARLNATNNTLRRELAEAREALGPFAEAARLYCIKDGVDPTARVGVFAHDLRRAARVLGGDDAKA